MPNKYFIYSSMQLNFRRETEKKLGRTFTPGQVIVNGVKTPFTEITSNPPNKSRYSDARSVYYGDPTKVKYTMPATT